jgi:hypothetical protein
VQNIGLFENRTDRSNMRVELSSAPGDLRRPNEDWVGATDRICVVVDGAGTPPALASGCIHGVAWYSSQLGVAALRHAQSGEERLSDVLAHAIADVAELHSPTCDLAHPGTPSAAIAITRRSDSSAEALVDYIVLADCSVVIAGGAHAEIITDRREAAVGERFRTSGMWSRIDSEGHQDEIAAYMASMRSVRNRPGGFWVAAADPAAAYEAIRGTRELDDHSVVALMSDGASRPIDLFEQMTPESFVHVLDTRGPDALIEEIRRTELTDPEGTRWPRAKRHDDASIVVSFDRPGRQAVR